MNHTKRVVGTGVPRVISTGGDWLDSVAEHRSAQTQIDTDTTNDLPRDGLWSLACSKYTALEVPSSEGGVIPSILSQSSNPDAYRIESGEYRTDENGSENTDPLATNAASTDPECPRCERPLTPAGRESWACWRLGCRLTWERSDTGGLMLGGEY